MQDIPADETTPRHPVTTPPRVALITRQLGVGGRELALLDLAGELRDRGWQIAVASMMPGSLDRRFRDLGVRTEVFENPRKLTLLRQLRLFLADFRPDIVHTHLSSAGLWGRLAAPQSGTRVIVHTHGGMTFRDNRIKRLLSEHLLARRTDAVICVCEAIRTHLVQTGRLDPVNMRVIPNGIRPGDLVDSPLRAMPSDPVILTVGRLLPVKGIDLLLHAVARLGGFHGRLMIAGSGPAERDLKRLTEALGITDRVEFLGYREDIPALLRNADLYVSASRSEGMSNALLQAMAAGVPAIASAVGGNSEVLSETGWLIPADDVDALADALQTAMANPRLAGKYAAAARRRVQECYSLARVIEAHEQLYRELVSA